MSATSRREALEKLASAEGRLRRALVLLHTWVNGGRAFTDTDQFLFEEETIWAGEGYTKKRLYEGGE